jgi:hypothetical protein
MMEVDQQIMALVLDKRTLARKRPLDTPKLEKATPTSRQPRGTTSSSSPLQKDEHSYNSNNPHSYNLLVRKLPQT